MFKHIILTVMIILSAYIFYAGKIINDNIYFNTDETYWISTAKIVPLLLGRKFNDSFWREYYGFTNFNSAKLIYGTGLFILGIKDVGYAGTAPDTYYTWEKYSGKPFPPAEPLYRMLIYARLISAAFAALGMGLIYIFLYLVTRKTFPGLLGTFITTVHPILLVIATHALSDSFFLFFQMILLILLILLVKTKYNSNKRQTLLLGIGTGVSLAWLTGVKLNGAMFLTITLAFLFLKSGFSRNNIKKVLAMIAVISASMIITFLILEPNLFFYPGYTLPQMIADRILITRQHIIYFSLTSPGHVILSLQEKLRSAMFSLFPLGLWLLFLTGALNTVRVSLVQRLKFITTIYGSLVITGILILGAVLSYVVFDEPRYYLPVLPFIILISVNWISSLETFVGTVLQSFRNVRKSNRFFFG